MFYFVMVNAPSGITIEDIQRALYVYPVQTYYRIAPNAWIVKTAPWVGNQASVISARLQPLVAPSGRHFVSQINVGDREGWMDKEFWNWVNTNGLS